MFFNSLQQSIPVCIDGQALPCLKGKNTQRLDHTQKVWFTVCHSHSQMKQNACLVLGLLFEKDTTHASKQTKIFISWW